MRKQQSNKGFSTEKTFKGFLTHTLTNNLCRRHILISINVINLKQKRSLPEEKAMASLVKVMVQAMCVAKAKLLSKTSKPAPETAPPPLSLLISFPPDRCMLNSLTAKQRKRKFLPHRALSYSDAFTFQTVKSTLNHHIHLQEPSLQILTKIIYFLPRNRCGQSFNACKAKT